MATATRTNGQLYGPDGEVLRFADDPPSDEELQSEIGGLQLGTFQSLLGAMPEIDDLEADEGEDIWDRMLDDAHVFANIFQLKNRILSKPWDLVPAGDSAEAERIADHVREEIGRIDLDQLVEHLLRMLTHKYAVAELVWEEAQGGSRPIGRALHHERKRFGLDEDGQLRFGLGQMEEVPPHKFVWSVLFQAPGRPYGKSLLQSVYWPWRFKQMGLEGWSTALDRLGVPSLVALAEGGDQQDLDKVANDLSDVANGSSSALSNVQSIETIGGEKVKGFQGFMRFLNAEISKGIATATLQVEEGRERTERGETRVHDDNARDVAQYVSMRLQDRINAKVIRPTVLFEFGEEGLPLAPALRYDWRDRATWTEVSEAMEQGVPLSVRLLRQDYNLPIPEDEKGDDAFVSPAVQPRTGVTQMADPALKHWSDEDLRNYLNGPKGPPSTGTALKTDRVRRELERRENKKKGRLTKSDVLPTPRPLSENAGS